MSTWVKYLPLEVFTSVHGTYRYQLGCTVPAGTNWGTRCLQVLARECALPPASKSGERIGRPLPEGCTVCCT
eukprot:jgi/Botrbrau1/15896/Bobra.40_1s0078.1